MAGRQPRPVDADAGFTLIEVLAAMVIFAVVSMGLLHSVLSAVDTSGDSRSRVIAANLAAGAIDQARADGLTDLEGVDTEVWDVTVEGTTYTVGRSASWVPGTGGTSCGASAGTSLLYKRVGIQVTWPNMGGTDPVRTDTVISPPAGVFDPTTGNLAISVLDRDAGATEFAQVRLTGPTTTMALTDDSGCAFFAGIPGGTYTIRITKSGHVDTQGNVEATGQATAVAGETVSYQADFDRAATLEIDGLADPDGDEVDADDFPLPAGSQLSLAHPGLQQGRRLVPAQLGTDVEGVFPFASGYSTWLGSCTDANPEGVYTPPAPPPPAAPTPPTPWWDGTVSAPVTAVDPGDDTEVEVRGAQVEVLLQTSVLGTDIPLVGVPVRFQHAAEAGTGCNGGETWALGSTGTDGRVRATLPYGRSWQVYAGGVLVDTVDLDPAADYPVVVQP
ncbi:type IV pilus modification PilV family protein [Aquipuribacter sp. MA13-6]|uniref:type IV pilus modification PilV family protein n=1 Tax=unclassified Aquipuribacter TaxID=2635084 RepID=UPI003EE92DF3